MGREVRRDQLSFDLHFREGNYLENKNWIKKNGILKTDMQLGKKKMDMKVYWVALKLSSVSDGCSNNPFLDFPKKTVSNWVIILLWYNYVSQFSFDVSVIIFREWDAGKEVK